MIVSRLAPAWLCRRRRRVYRQTQRPNRVLLNLSASAGSRLRGWHPRRSARLSRPRRPSAIVCCSPRSGARGARISEVLALRPRDIHRQGLVLLNLKNPSRLVKTAHLSAAHAGLPGDLLASARDNGLADDEPLFFSRQRTADGRRRAIDRVRAWQIVKSASERADMRVLALRATGHGAVGEPAPVHPHLFRHARVRQIVRHTKSLALAQKQAGRARLHTEYLSLSDTEAAQPTHGVPA